MRTARREFLAAAALGVAGFAGAAAPEKQAEEVSATEDLMREHGVLRRILLIYEKALRQAGRTGKLPAEALNKSAALVRRFVEDYHEKLEESFIFPLFEKRQEMASLVVTLRKQHDAGRKLTDEILRASGKAKEIDVRKPSQATDNLARAIMEFDIMYRPHAAREDTVLFPALHRVLSDQQMDELGEKFEAEENRLFGKEGFERVVEQVADVEKQLKIYDLDEFTPKP
ncbi:MAG: hemerythrin domain-containing protein [Planctomycetaceae bacterium]|nr:hemerythrin domain-containing protein [Planctomycetaceae bacterium]